MFHFVIYVIHIRPTNNLDTMLGLNQPNAQHPLKHFSSISQAQATSLAANQEPLKFSQIPLQQIQNSESSSQSFGGTIPDLQKQSHPNGHQVLSRQ